MNKYLKLYESHSQYVNPEIKPNVSYCRQENEVHYNPRTWADEYFTTVARENGTISFNIWKSMGTEYITSISYSTDNGETWTTINNTNDKTENLVIDVNVNNGDKVMWKGDATQLGFYDGYEDDAVGSFFSSTCEFDAQGNVMSFLYGDNFKGETTIENEYAFACLFSDYDEVKTCKVVNAKNLSLPATTLTSGCYKFMFYGCTSLTTAPELPATTLTQSCYLDMFFGCTSLTTAPVLPATTLVSNCYSGMFKNCTNLNYIKAMFTTTPSTSYTTNWVSGVAANGTFVKNASATWTTTGVNAVPTGWTVQIASE